ncbi:MAG TPA: hypothetical protein VK966_02145 [Longimicrobiales bacterium]|nr:hypothetical protein [Longimicrobiales bacterium]
MSETEGWAKVRAKLTTEALSLDLIGIVESMTPEDRLEFCRAVAFEQRIFDGLCDVVVHRHGWLWKDSDEAWGWGKYTADKMREKLIPLMPDAAVHLLANEKDKVARLEARLEAERLYSIALHEALSNLQMDVPHDQRIRVERPRPDYGDMKERIGVSGRHEREARAAVEEATA